MSYKTSIAAMLGFAAILLPSNDAFACQCTPYTDAQRVRMPVAIIPVGRAVKIEPGEYPSWQVVTIKVLLSGKGAREGEMIKAVFSNDNSCSRRVPKLGQEARELVFTGSGKVPHAEDGCIGFPSTDSGIAALVDYRSRWLALDDKARAAPNNIGTQLALGDYLADWRDNRGALVAYRQARRLAPSDRAIALKVVAIETRLQHFQRASKILNAVTRANPSDARARLMQLQLESRQIDNKEGLHRKTTTPYLVSATLPAMAGQDVGGVELDQVELTYLIASGTNWAGAKAYRSAMPAADLSGANLTRADFSNTDLTGASLSQATTIEARIVDSTLTGVDASGLSAARTDFSGTVLARGNLRDADLQDASFYTADLSGADLRGANLRGADFKLAKVDCETKFPDGFDLQGQRLLPVATCDGRYNFNFDGVNFIFPWSKDKPLARGWRKISFADKDMREASFRNARFWEKFSFKGADISGVDFTGAKLAGADFTNAIARNARFINVGEGAVFNGADLTGATFSGDGTVNRFGNRSFSLTIYGSAPRLTGTIIRSANIRLWGKAPGNDPNLASILDATIEDSAISCSSLQPESLSKRKDAEIGRREWEDYVTLLDMARKVSQVGKGNTLIDQCAQTIQTYLADGCTAGRKAAGFNYTCPPP